MKNNKLLSSDEIAALLDTADEHLLKAEYPQAEELAIEILASKPQRKEHEVRMHLVLGYCCAKNEGLYEEAERHYEIALRLAESDSNFFMQSKVLYKKACLHFELWHRIEAFQAAEQSLVFAVKAQDKRGQAWILTLMADCLDPTEYKLALEYQTRALALAEESGHKRTIAGMLHNIGLYYTNKGDYQSALEYYSRALPLLETINPSYSAGCLNNIGNVYSGLGEYHKALEFRQRALSIREKIGDKRDIAETLQNIGNVYSNIADYGQALDYYSRALILLQGPGSTKLKCNLFCNIGETYSFLYDYSRALDYNFRALAYAEETGDKELIAVAVGNIANSYLSLSEYSHALEYSERGLDLSLQINDLQQIGICMQTIANAHLKLGNLDAAYQVLLDTLRHRREVLKSNRNVAETLLNLGLVLILQGKSEEGLSRLQEALQLADELGEKKTSSEAHKELADMYSKMGDIAKENEHLKKHYALKDEIFSEESRKKVEAFNFRVAIAKEEQEKEVHRLKAEHYERELANATLQLVAQTELLSELRDGLMGIVRKFPMPDGAAKELRERLKTLPCKSVDWDRFDMQFKSAHPEFTKKLLAKCPDLTPTEVRICSLLRMNLRSFEIAKLFCLSERSVEGHRTHIRKKMKLPRNEDLMLHLAKM